MKHLFTGFLVICMTVITSAPGSSAIPEKRIESVKFAPGSSSKSISGRLKGSSSVDYLVRAGAGQTLKVELKKSNPQNFFNIIAPGAGDQAMFVGQTGEGFKGVLPDDGDYAVRVYLMRPAARRNESSNYTLSIGVSGVALAPLAASKDALIQGTRFHASASINCKPPFDTKPARCETFVVRRGFDGTATVEIRLPIGSPRHILFIKGKPVASDAQASMTVTRNKELSIVRIGADEQYEIPDALVFGD
jgi:hypothetical protein